MPDADPCDGLLDVLLIQPVSRLQVFAIIGKYKAGRYAEYPALIRHVRTRHLEVQCPAPVEINLDGELRWAQRVQIGVAKEKIRFFLPKNSHLEADLPGVSVCIECTNGAGSVCPWWYFPAICREYYQGTFMFIKF